MKQNNSSTDSLGHENNTFLKQSHAGILSAVSKKELRCGESVKWDAPSETQPDVWSEDLTWSWSLPLNKSKEEFKNEIFMENESASTCTGFCCMGASSLVRGFVKPSSCRQHLNYFFEFNPRHVPIYSLVDSIALWKKANPTMVDFNILFIGDSVQGQVFHAALCELRRSPQVSKIEYSVGENTVSFDDRKAYLIPVESKIHFHDAELESTRTTVSYFSMYRSARDEEVLFLMFRKFHIIFLGWGLHYTSLPPNIFEQDMNKVFNALARVYRTSMIVKPTIIWMGHPKQHFSYEDFGHNSYGWFIETFNTEKCSATSRVCSGHHGQDLRNDLGMTVARNLGFTTSRLVLGLPSHCIRNFTSPRLHLFPFVETTGPFHMNHRSAFAGLGKRRDCTHICWAPNYYVSIWQATFLAVNASACLPEFTPRYKSGPQKGFSRYAGIIYHPVNLTENNSRIVGPILRDLKLYLANSR